MIRYRLRRRCPAHAVARDIGRHLVPAIEFAERDVVAALPQSGYDRAAAAVDRKNRVGSTMRNEEARVSVRRTLDDETRGECDDAREQVAVDHSERDRIRGAIGEPADRHARGIYGDSIEHAL